VTWYALRVDPGARRDEVIATLFAQGAGGLIEDGLALVTHFESEHDAHAAARAVDHAAETWSVEAVPDVDWTVAWRERARVWEAGALVIAPPWLADGCDPARSVVIDPGMAFGTGDHATTRGVLRLMSGAGVQGAVAADLGTGSAVLAIALARLGAARVYAIENDPDALGNASENITRNGVDDRVQLLEGDAAVMLRLVAPVDIVVANITSSVHRLVLPAVTASLSSRARVILAGILLSERDQMIADLRASGWRVLAEDIEEDWWSVLLSRA
jgi:ribosomal protein L11 methyltransferase